MGDTTEIMDFDDIGVYVIPPNENTRYFNLPKLCIYCEEKGIQTSKLTNEELKQFEVQE